MSKAGGGVKSLTVRVYEHPTVTHAEKKSPFAKYSNQQMTEAPAVGLFCACRWRCIRATCLQIAYKRRKKKNPATELIAGLPLYWRRGWDYL